MDEERNRRILEKSAVICCIVCFWGPLAFFLYMAGTQGHVATAWLPLVIAGMVVSVCLGIGVKSSNAREDHTPVSWLFVVKVLTVTVAIILLVLLLSLAMFGG